MSKKQILLFSFLLFPLIVFGYYNPGEPLGFVNDYAEILTAEQKINIEEKISAWEKETTNEIAVVTIPSLEGDTIENFAVSLFEDWGIGKEEKDNGVLFLMALEEREVRIEVGYGLEGDLTDAESYWIIEKTIIPSFKKGNYYEGISGGVSKIISAVSGENIIPEESIDDSGQVPWFVFFFFIPLFLVWIASILGRTKSWWPGGVAGGIAGVVIGFLKGFIFTGLIAIALLIPFGFLFDYVVSRGYKKGKKRG